MAEIPLPFPVDPVATFGAFRARWPCAVWLDGGAGGEYSIMAADPAETLVARTGRTWRTTAAGTECLSCGDPLAALNARLTDRAASRSTQQPDWPAPFAGGAVGYFSYELGRRLQGQTIAPEADTLTEMAVGLYDWALVLDHERGKAWLAGEVPSEVAEWLATGPETSPDGWETTGPVMDEPGLEAYALAFDQVAHYLREGDCYQVNLTRRLGARFQGDPLGVYREFRALAGGPFSAYLDLPGGPVLSGSPERFLRLRDGRVETQPIKGTRPRSANPGQDAAAREALLASPKDRAENVMIVDLLRNDLGQSCEIGSVRVPALCRVESFATVHHMVSVVTGQMAPQRSATDLLRDCLPGGSITGAPKFRAMEIIDELEAGPRGVYCGAIGYIGYDGAMDTNIAIRTLTARNGWLDYRAGGGVVIDSRCQEEFDETESKASAFRQLVEHGQRADAALRQNGQLADTM